MTAEEKRIRAILVLDVVLLLLAALVRYLANR